MTELLVASLACAAWLYLLLLRGGFWRAAERDDVADCADFMPAAWPRVVAVVPARNEAEVIATSVGSLLRQDYPGAFGLPLRLTDWWSCPRRCFPTRGPASCGR